MPDREDSSDEMKNRLASRFGEDTNDESDTSDESEENDQPDESDTHDKGDKKASSNNRGESDTSSNGDKEEKTKKSNKKNMSSKSDKPTSKPHDADNIKEEWGSRLFYLPEQINKEVGNEFDRLKYESGVEFDSWKPKKNRHYYPLLVEDGLDAIRAMSAQDFRERLEELELIEEYRS